MTGERSRRSLPAAHRLTGGRLAPSMIAPTGAPADGSTRRQAHRRTVAAFASGSAPAHRLTACALDDRADRLTADGVGADCRGVRTQAHRLTDPRADRLTADGLRPR